MQSIRKAVGRARVIAALIGVTVLFTGYAVAHSGDDVHPIFSSALPNVPGKALTAVVVNYAPGGTSPAHHHAGSVFAYVLSGAIRSQVTPDGAPKVYHAGEAFFEPPGSSHLVSENASATEPASLLAVFVADEGATLTMPGVAQ
jgi:quercetin dioxygenase-like cupin family protein